MPDKLDGVHGANKEKMWITTVYWLQIPVYINFQSRRSGNFIEFFLNYFGMQRQTDITLTRMRSVIQWRLYLVAYIFISWLISFWQAFKIASHTKYLYISMIARNTCKHQYVCLFHLISTFPQYLIYSELRNIHHNYALRLVTTHLSNTLNITDTLPQN